MKNGYELVKEIVSTRYEGESIWDYAWILLVPVTIMAWCILGAIL